MVSRYTLRGRRSAFRRRDDQTQGGYVDRYPSGLLVVLVVLLVLNVTDAVLTIVILDYGGREINPFIGVLMARCGDGFWFWKFLLVAVAILFLCLHSNFRRVKKGIWAVTLVYCGVVLYQAYLILFQIPLGR